MQELLKIFTLQQWVIIGASFFNALAIAWGTNRFFKSRFWVESITDAITGRTVGGDLMKAGAFVLACVLIVAITIAKLVFMRDSGPEVAAFVFALFSYSGVLQDIKRRGRQTPTPNIDISNSNVKVGPNGSAIASEDKDVSLSYKPGSITPFSSTQSE